jgi:hypothetical protein
MYISCLFVLSCSEGDLLDAWMALMSMWHDICLIRGQREAEGRRQEVRITATYFLSCLSRCSRGPRR